jgi:hypothetical protein
VPAVLLPAASRRRRLARGPPRALVRVRLRAVLAVRVWVRLMRGRLPLRLRGRLPQHGLMVRVRRVGHPARARARRRNHHRRGILPVRLLLRRHCRRTCRLRGGRGMTRRNNAQALEEHPPLVRRLLRRRRLRGRRRTARCSRATVAAQGRRKRRARREVPGRPRPAAGGAGRAAAGAAQLKVLLQRRPARATAATAGGRDAGIGAEQAAGERAKVERIATLRLAARGGRPAAVTAAAMPRRRRSWHKE